MGLVYADVELINADDLSDARKYRIGDEEVRRMSINILVDSGSFMLAINEDIQSQLQIPFLEKRTMQLANGHIGEFDVVSPVEVRFKNRRVVCSAVVLDGNAEPLLGVIPLEEMDVLIHPTRQELIVNPEHPYYAVLKLK